MVLDALDVQALVSVPFFLGNSWFQVVCSFLFRRFQFMFFSLV